MTYQASYVTPVLATAGVLGGAYCAYYLYKAANKNKLPQQWVEVGSLKDIAVYPIKSCAGIALTKAECTILGLKQGWLRDRVLMVIDEKNNFITARAYPELLLVKPNVKSSILNLKYTDLEPVNIDLAEVIATQTPFNAKVWGVTVPVYDCGAESSEWISRIVDQSGNNFRLAYYASNKSRALRSSTNKMFKFTKNDTGAFPDEVPYNLLNEASLEDLNDRLKDFQVTYQNFRPNFVLKGAKPYDEDNWKFVKIGENIFEIIKPCTRCVLTTIDPETGIRNSMAEPLETLKSYRLADDPELRKVTGTSPRMGIQMALRSGPGTVSLNDKIYVA